MAWAIIKIKDNPDGSINFEAELSDPPDDNSLAHKALVRFIEFTDQQQANNIQNSSVIAEKQTRTIIGVDGQRMENSKRTG